MPSIGTLKQDLFNLATLRGFCDPVTGCFPLSETALSGFLCLYAQRQKVQWDKVPLYDVESFKNKGDAGDLIQYPGSFLTEYPLLHRNGAEERIWGWMPADILYVSADSASIALFENKIGGDIAYEPTPASNQFARQLDYLITFRDGLTRNVSLVLVSTRQMFELRWYRTEFADALKHNDRFVTAPGYLATWEDIFEAIDH